MYDHADVLLDVCISSTSYIVIHLKFTANIFAANRGNSYTLEKSFRGKASRSVNCFPRRPAKISKREAVRKLSDPFYYSLNLLSLLPMPVTFVCLVRLSSFVDHSLTLLSPITLRHVHSFSRTRNHPPPFEVPLVLRESRPPTSRKRSRTNIRNRGSIFNVNPHRLFFHLDDVRSPDIRSIFA